MPFVATESPHAASSIPTAKREALEELLAESLPVLYQVEVKGRAGVKRGRLGNLGLRFTYDRDSDETPVELADQVVDAIEEHAATYGAHVYEIFVHVAEDGKTEAVTLPQTVTFKLERGAAPAGDNRRDIDLDRQKHSTKTIRELEAIVARQAKSAENLVAMATSARDLFAPRAEVEIKRLEIEERKMERESEAVETAAQMEAATTVLGPVLTQLVPSVQNWINAQAAKAAGAPMPQPDPRPPWERAASLFTTLTDEQRAELRAELGDPLWLAVVKLGDVDNADAFVALVDDVKGQLTLQNIMACQKILSPEQSASLMELVQ